MWGTWTLLDIRMKKSLQLVAVYDVNPNLVEKMSGEDVFNRLKEILYL